MQRLPMKYARRRLETFRDEHGVPHIVAGSWRASLYGLGYLHALDRPTQLLFARAVASGRSAELIADKPELVETDRFFRRAGLQLRLDEEVRRLDDNTFGDVTAYCEGVNDGMKESGRSLPMWATGLSPLAVEPASGAADWQFAELRRAGRRPATKRTAAGRTDSNRRRRHAAARTFLAAAWIA